MDWLDEPNTDIDFGVGDMQMVSDSYKENLASILEDGLWRYTRTTQFRN